MLTSTASWRWVRTSFSSDWALATFRPWAASRASRRAASLALISSAEASLLSRVALSSVGGLLRGGLGAGALGSAAAGVPPLPPLFPPLLPPRRAAAAETSRRRALRTLGGHDCFELRLDGLELIVAQSELRS